MGDRKKIVVKHEGQVVEEFQARAFDFGVDPAYVVTGRRVRVPSAQIEDRLYVDDRVGGQVVAVVPSTLDQCWNIYFAPTEKFLRSLRPRSHRRAKVEADDVPLAQGSSGRAAEGEGADPGAGAVPESEGGGDGNG